MPKFRKISKVSFVKMWFKYKYRGYVLKSLRGAKNAILGQTVEDRAELPSNLDWWFRELILFVSGYQL